MTARCASLTLMYAERDVLIEALDQFVSNSEEAAEFADEAPSQQVATARSLLQFFQEQKLEQLGVSPTPEGMVSLLDPCEDVCRITICGEAKG